jgi:hypothetical protein
LRHAGETPANAEGLRKESGEAPGSAWGEDLPVASPRALLVSLTAFAGLRLRAARQVHQATILPLFPLKAAETVNEWLFLSLFLNQTVRPLETARLSEH